MSGISSNYDPFGTFPTGLQGNVIANAALVAQKLTTLTEQVSSGYISSTYAGLGSGLQTALVTAPAIAAQTELQNTISSVTGTLGVAQTALGQIQTIASTFFADTANLNSLDPSQVDSTAADAQAALVQVAGLLNTTDGGSYVFAGQDSGNPPVPSAETILGSGFFTQIQAAVANLAANGATATEQTTLNVAASNASGTTPFSTGLSQPGGGALPVVFDGNGGTIPVGILANANASVTSTGSTTTSTTGSYIRDILRGLATLGSLSSSQVNDTGFTQLVTDTQASLGNALTAIDVDSGVLGNHQAALQAVTQASTQTVIALQTQLSGAEDVDMAATISKLTQTQIQLQSSYQVIADSQADSLVKYLTSTTG